MKKISDEDKKAIKIWLKENLTIEVDVSYDCSVDVTILLEREKIAKGSGSKYKYRIM